MRTMRLLLGFTLLAGCTSGMEPDGESQSEVVARVPVLIGFRGEAAGVRGAVAAARGEVTSQWDEIHAVAAELPASAIEALTHNPNVVYIEPDRQVDAIGVVGAGEDPWGNIDVHADATRVAGILGAGVNVCIIDTGIDPNHPELAAAYRGGWDFVDNSRFGGDSTPWDTRNNCSTTGCKWGTGHGTHVSGTVLAQLGSAGALAAGMDPGGIVGVASGASLYMLRVLGLQGSGSTSAVVNGLLWCKNNVPAPRIASLSLGSSSSSTTERNAFQAAYDAGVLTFAAAGNGGSSAVSYPAGYASVISVAAVDSNNVKASFSQYNADVELAAPGVAVLSTVPRGTGAATVSGTRGDYASWSGTSMATPHAAACGALAWSTHLGESNAQIRDRLTGTAVDLGAGGRDTFYGFGLIDCLAASAP